MQPSNPDQAVAIASESGQEPRVKRRNKLILPGFQIKLVAQFATLSALGLLLQFLVFSAVLADASQSLPSDGVILMDRMQPLLLRVMLISVGLLAPILAWAGVLTTFRIAGPIYRFHRYLESVAEGQRPADCKLRKGDQLQSLCELINLATRPLREARTDDEAESSAGSEGRTAA